MGGGSSSRDIDDGGDDMGCDDMGCDDDGADVNDAKVIHFARLCLLSRYFY